MVSRRGATLIELMTAATLFLIMLGSVLSFYVYASGVSARQEKVSEGYRSAMLHLDKLETVLGYSRIYAVQREGSVVVFEPPSENGAPPTVVRRWPQLSGRLATIYVDESGQRVVRRDNGANVTLFRLPYGEKVVFSLAGRVLTMTLRGGEFVGAREPFTLTREILVENPVRL